MRAHNAASRTVRFSVVPVALHKHQDLETVSNKE
jgi:hypothetical protein